MCNFAENLNNMNNMKKQLYVVDNTKLTPHFSLVEFFPNKAYRPTYIDSNLRKNLYKCALALELIRKYFNAPITITSGYRTAAQNNAPDCKGSKTSAHLHGLAVDITPTSGDVDDFRLLALYARNMRHEFDQVIVNFSKRYIHIGLQSDISKNRNDFWTIPTIR